MRLAEEITTTAASVAFGIKAISGASSRSVASVTAAVTSSAIWLCAPALWLTAVCVAPPPAGMELNKPPATLAAPSASSSRLGEGARCCDALGKAHQSDTGGARPHLCDQAEIGKSPVRKSARDVAYHGYAIVGQSQQARSCNAQRHGDQRRWCLRDEAMQKNHQ